MVGKHSAVITLVNKINVSMLSTMVRRRWLCSHNLEGRPSVEAWSAATMMHASRSSRSSSDSPHPDRSLDNTMECGGYNIIISKVTVQHDVVRSLERVLADLPPSHGHHSSKTYENRLQHQVTREKYTHSHKDLEKYRIYAGSTVASLRACVTHLRFGL